MQARVANQIFLHDVGRNHQMTDMLGNDHQRRRQNRQHRHPLEARCIEGWQGKPRGFHHATPVNDAHKGREQIACHHTHQNRDDRQEATEQHGTEYRYRQRDQRNQHGFAVGRTAFSGQQAGHIGGDTRQLQTNDGDNRAHRCRGEHHVEPAGARAFHNQRHDAEQHAAQDKSAQRDLITQWQQQQHRRDKGKTGTEVGGNFAFTDKEINQCADAVEQQHRRRVDVEQNRHQYRGTKHGKQVLQAEWNGLQ